MRNGGPLPHLKDPTVLACGTMLPTCTFKDQGPAKFKLQDITLAGGPSKGPSTGGTR